jgi:DNA-binding PadR family transcriptional regulator
MISDRDVQDDLPLTEVTTFILLSLVDEPKHGYAIMKDVEGLSEARVQISTGTLYGALSRLLDQGWIARWEGQVQHTETPGRPRKTYTLTRVGRRVLEAEIRRLQSVVAAARARTAEASI